MKIGVTGTRSGMNDKQSKDITTYLTTIIAGRDVIYDEEYELHHGDCEGVDVQVAEIAHGLGYKVVCHPPIKDDLRALHKSDVFRKPLSYFARNRNIVDETDVLIVVPYQNTRQNSGGTWYTHSYCEKKQKPFMIVWPQGGILTHAI